MSTTTKLNPYPGYNTYIPQVNPGRSGNLRSEEDDRYIVTTKIMVLALAVLFAVVFFVVCLHIYAKWIWRTSPARGPVSFSFWPRRRRNRASPGNEIVLDADALDINMVMGLGKSAVEALPKFRYKTADHLKTSTDAGDSHLECPICLGKFEEDEMGRALPKCGHSFHLECIDMWLYSHSTCPLCRAILEPDADESISLNLESPTIQVFHLEPLPTPRRLRGSEPDLNSLPQLLPPQPPPDHQQSPPDGQPSPPEPSPSIDQPDTANKRADSIPANILFWGNHTQHTNVEQSRLSTVVNRNSPPSTQVVIDIDVEPDQQQAGEMLPAASHLLLPRSTNASLHRLLGRSRLPAATSPEDGQEMMRVTPFRPSPSPSPSPSSRSSSTSRLGGHGGVFSEEH
ncbi:hypothetical protein M758_1G026200 [Ceratodon purpureus]|nr:hypothetical protein M758_1G026200 [Ceratodon purpureus]